MGVSEEAARDVSMCYQEGRTARIRDEGKATNPHPATTPFGDAWDQGWDDEDGLARAVMRIPFSDGYQG
jgi:hypothetical protein